MFALGGIFNNINFRVEYEELIKRVKKTILVGYKPPDPNRLDGWNPKEAMVTGHNNL